VWQAPLDAQNSGPKTAKTAKAGKGPAMVKGIPSAKAAAKTTPAEKHGNLPSISKASVKPLKLAKVDPQTAERAPQAAAHIDGLVEANYKLHKIEPNALTTDEQFVRRIYLDITGTIPTYEQNVSFLESKDDHKRDKLIDDLLNSPGYASHFFNFWANIL